MAAKWTGVAGLGLLLAACQPAPESYYPLEAGATWRYVMSGEVHTFAGWARERDGIHRQTVGRAVDDYFVDVSTQPPRPLGGREATPMMSASQLQQGFGFSFWVRDALGVAEIARQPRGAAEPTLLAAPVYALRFPLRIGTSWDTSEPTQFAGQDVTLQGSARIAAVDETVTVPAGTFRRCVRVDSEASARALIAHLHGRDIDGEAEIETRNSLWLAPGVGPVKVTSREAIRPSALGSGEQTLELVRFSPR